MLRQRIITALILAPLALGAILFLPLMGFQIAFAGIIALGAWEWAKLTGLNIPLLKSMYTALVAAICFSLYNKASCNFAFADFSSSTSFLSS